MSKLTGPSSSAARTAPTGCRLLRVGLLKGLPRFAPPLVHPTPPFECGNPTGCEDPVERKPSHRPSSGERDAKRDDAPSNHDVPVRMALHPRAKSPNGHGST